MNKEYKVFGIIVAFVVLIFGVLWFNSVHADEYRFQIKPQPYIQTIAEINSVTEVNKIDINFDLGSVILLSFDSHPSAFPGSPIYVSDDKKTVVNLVLSEVHREMTPILCREAIVVIKHLDKDPVEFHGTKFTTCITSAGQSAVKVFNSKTWLEGQNPDSDTPEQSM